MFQVGDRVRLTKEKLKQKRNLMWVKRVNKSVMTISEVGENGVIAVQGFTFGFVPEWLELVEPADPETEYLEQRIKVGL